ncbi:MAG: hypothetical protein QOH92_601 [Chloroflexota bacterium]|nr:hypothetical protein [Chloroflexota bacterium]
MRIPDSIGKAPVLFLTGAGASVALGRHTSAQFVKEFFDSARVRKLDNRDSAILQFTNALRFKPETDIEKILALLEENVADGNRFRDDPEFVRRVLFGTTTSLDPFIGMNSELRDSLYAEIIDHFSAVDSDKAGELYGPILADFFDWFREVPGVGPTIPFFTLNYDTAIEGAASALGLRLIDGLMPMRAALGRRWSRAPFETFEPQPDTISIVLFKLHGSVLWGRSEQDGKEVISELPLLVGLNPGPYKQAVIYPTLGPKPVREEPFRTGYRFLRTCLGNAKVLFVIGCSLRDGEIQDSISDAMDDNPELHIVSIAPDADHARVAELTHCDPSRIAAVQREFTFPAVGLKGDNDVMGSLRGYATSAAGDSNARRSYPFGVTHPDWPAALHKAAILHAVRPGTRLRPDDPYDGTN